MIVVWWPFGQEHLCPRPALSRDIPSCPPPACKRGHDKCQVTLIADVYFHFSHPNSSWHLCLDAPCPIICIASTCCEVEIIYILNHPWVTVRCRDLVFLDCRIFISAMVVGCWGESAVARERYKKVHGAHAWEGSPAQNSAQRKRPPRPKFTLFSLLEGILGGQF